MRFAFWMVLVAGVLPYVTTGLAKSGGFDNRAPRDWVNSLSGWRRRADWAHRNHFEAFAPFAASVFAATLNGRSHLAADVLSGTFIAARVGYTVAYVADQPALRSVLWFIGLGCTLALFWLGA